MRTDPDPQANAIPRAGRRAATCGRPTYPRGVDPAPTSPPPAARTVDLVVVGGGTAGMVGAKTAAALGARTLLVERDRTGGDCLWTGCVPSKALLASAHAAAVARGSAHLGVSATGVGVDFSAVMGHVHAAIAHIAPVDSPEALQQAGVEVLAGEAVLTGPDRLRVGAQDIVFGQALLTTGAAPSLPPLPGLQEASPLTSETIWDLSDLPDRLVVLGAGSIGCELAQAMARLGARVTLVEQAGQVLPPEDPAAARVLTGALQEDGVQVLTGRAVSAVEGRSGDGGLVHLADGTSVEFDVLLAVLGRTPRTASLGLAAAGVDVDDHGFVVVDQRLRTTNPRIWAAGDLTGHPQFTHVAGVHGSVAATNAVLGTRRRAAPVVPRVTFTDPEVAAVGRSTDGDAAAAAGLRAVTVGHEHVDRAVAEGRTEGFTTLALDRRGRVVGATIVGPRAGESLGELTLAVSRGLRARDVAGVVHPYPTYDDGPWNAALADLARTLSSPALKRLASTVATVRRGVAQRRGR